jgi:4,5-dihydroxyphthalate decarboxylase
MVTSYEGGPGSSGLLAADSHFGGRTVLNLSIALSDNSRTRGLIEGTVPVEGIRLIPTVVHPSEMFWRQLRYGDFDVSEMSLSSIAIATSQGSRDWVGLPVFTMRKFFHTGIVVRKNAGIDKPSDLKGKRVGVAEYQQTAAIWSRGVLQHEFGVKAQDMHWFMERNPDKSHGGGTGFKPPAGVKLEYIPPTTNIGEMLVKGELDAAITYLNDPNLVDRSRVDIDNEPSLRPLFLDKGAEMARYFGKTGVYPINHTVVMRRSIYEKHPWIALNLYAAFLKSAALSYENAKPYLAGYFETGLVGKDISKILSKDVLPYGLKAARNVLENVTQYVHEQGLTDRRVGLEEIFAPNTLDL